MIKMFVKGSYRACIYKYTPLGVWGGRYYVEFNAFGVVDYDYKGKEVYDNLKSAIRAAQRYVNKMYKLSDNN